MWSSRRSYEATTCVQIIFISKKKIRLRLIKPQQSEPGDLWTDEYLKRRGGGRERQESPSSSSARIPGNHLSLSLLNTHQYPSPTIPIPNTHLLQRASTSVGGSRSQIANKGGHRDIGKDFMCMCLLWSFVTKYDPALEKNLLWCLQSQRGSEGGNLGTLSKAATFLTLLQGVNLFWYFLVWFEKRFF